MTTPEPKPLQVNDIARAQDQRQPLLRALKVGALALLVLTVVSLMGWGAARDLPGCLLYTSPSPRDS